MYNKNNREQSFQGCKHFPFCKVALRSFIQQPHVIIPETHGVYLTGIYLYEYRSIC